MIELLSILIIFFSIYGLYYYRESVTILSGMLIIVSGIIISILLLIFKKIMKD